MEFKIKLAGLVIGISSLYTEVFTLCRDYLSDGAVSLHITVTPEDIAFERKKSLRESALTNRPVIRFPDSYLETLAVYRKIVSELLPYGIWLMHGSAVSVNGETVLFTAPSGVGKTTHTKLWLKNIPGAFVVNGDKPLLRLQNGICEVCGTPWAGKEHLGRNTILPLRAICSLNRGKENRIEESTFDDLHPVLIRQTYRPSDPVSLKTTMALMEQMRECVRFYKLSCTMEDEAAKIAYEKIILQKN